MKIFPLQEELTRIHMNSVNRVIAAIVSCFLGRKVQEI